MVLNNDSYEEHTRRLLVETQSELNEAQDEIKVLQDKAVTLASEVKAYEIALQGYLRRTGRQEIDAPNWIKLLGEQTHREKLITMAKHNNSIVRVSQATNILHNKKLTRAKKRATTYSMVQVHLADMTEDGIFEKIGPGEYKLVGSQQKLPVVS